MPNKLLFLIPALALFGQGCINVTVPTPPAGEAPTPAKPSAETSECVDTPKVYYHAKATYTAAEIRQIERDIVEPIKAHYDDATYGRAASIAIRRDGADLIVDIIVDQAWTTDAGYEGVLLRRLPDGSYEGWTPTDPGPGYEG